MTVKVVPPRATNSKYVSENCRFSFIEHVHEKCNIPHAPYHWLNKKSSFMSFIMKLMYKIVICKQNI